MNKFEFFKTGSVQSSYGGQYSYKVIGPVVDFMIGKSYLGPAQGLLGEVRSLVGEE